MSPAPCRTIPFPGVTQQFSTLVLCRGEVNAVWDPQKDDRGRSISMDQNAQQEYVTRQTSDTWDIGYSNFWTVMRFVASTHVWNAEARVHTSTTRFSAVQRASCRSSWLELDRTCKFPQSVFRENQQR